MPSSKGTKKPTSKTGAKKGGVVDFAPLTAAGVLYASAYYGKSTRKGRKINGGNNGNDVMNTVPGGSTPVISAGKQEMPNSVTPAVPGQVQQTGSYIPFDVRSINPATAGSDGGSESRSPLVKGELDLKNNSYIGAASSSRAAPINEPSGLLQQGGAKKGKSKSKSKKRGGAEASIGSAVQSPLVTYQLPLTKNNDYVGGISASLPASVDASYTLMGGAKKGKGKGKGKGRKQKGGNDEIAYLPNELMPASTSPATPLPPVPSMASQSCGHIGASIPPGTSSGGKLGLSAVVPGAVGGVSGQEEPSQFGGAKKGQKSRKGKKRGGADEDTTVDGGDSVEDTILAYEGGGKKKGRKVTKGKKRGGVPMDDIFNTIKESIQKDPSSRTNEEKNEILNLIKNTADIAIYKEPNTGNNLFHYAVLANDDRNLDYIHELLKNNAIGMDRSNNQYRSPYSIASPNVRDFLRNRQPFYKREEWFGGAKKGRKSKKRGGADGVEPFNAENTTQTDALGGFDSLLSDLKKQVGGTYKKKGGADEVEPFNAGNATQADALGGFDSLLSDLKKQVGGKYKKKGGAFKLYARELSSLSKKLQKLV